MGRVGLVEAPEFFQRFDWASLGVDAVVNCGRVSDRILGWVDTPDVTSIVYCADFDPIGLGGYLRVHGRSGAKVRAAPARQP